MPLFGKKKPETPPQISGDAGVLEQLRAAGVDLAKALELRHYLYFKKESDARAVASQFGESNEWRVEVRPAATGPEWLLLLTHRAVIDLATIEGLRASLTAMAARMGGEYDGWEAGVPE